MLLCASFLGGDRWLVSKEKNVVRVDCKGFEGGGGGGHRISEKKQKRFIP